jgi:hypothetical protein
MGEQHGNGGTAAQDEETDVTIRTDAAHRRVTGARLVATLAVLGGTLGLAGLGAFGDLAAGSAPGPTLVTVELTQAVGQP